MKAKVTSFNNMAYNIILMVCYNLYVESFIQNYIILYTSITMTRIINNGWFHT